MKAMNKFRKYRKGTISMEISSLMPEKFINLLWRNGIVAKNIKKVNITTVMLEINLSDYGEISKLAKRADAKIVIVGRNGLSFFLMKLKNRSALSIGVILFAGLIYYLSTFIWNIEITTEHYISPYELRNQIKALGITPGLRKKNIDVYDIENKITRNNDEIMWIKVRIEGIKLKVDVIERQSPPIIISKKAPGDLIANKEGIVARVFTTEGTAVVKMGDTIQKGDILVKGEQGKEGSVYPVHAQGEVIAKTFYEKIREVPLSTRLNVRTGKSISNLYIKFLNKKIYLKNSLIPYSKYDKIEARNNFINSEIYYEVQEKNIAADASKITAEMYAAILRDLDKNVVIIDKIVDAKKEIDKYIIKVLVVAEENIALEDK